MQRRTNNRILGPLALFMLGALGACDAPDDSISEDPAPVELRGAWQCEGLETSLSLEDACTPNSDAGETVVVRSEPIDASRWEIASALLDAPTFGDLPRPLPPDFEPPPVTHSTRIAPVEGAAFLDHYALFYGVLRATTVSMYSTPDSVVIEQLWRIDNVWQEHDIRDGYPEWSDEDVAAHVGQPILDEGLYTSVRFSITEHDGHSEIEVEQTGVPSFNAPIFTVHWSLLYLDPLAEYLASV